MIFQKLVDIIRLTQEIRQSSIVTAIESISAAGTNCDIQFKATLSDTDTITLNRIIANHIPTPLPNTTIQSVSVITDKITASGKPQVAMYEPEGSAATIVTYNFCDKTTWWMTALPIVLETLTPTTANSFITYHPFIIDMTHGKCYDEDTATTADPTLIPKIYVDDILRTTGYTINYHTGVITFASPVIGTVKASYKYAINSYFILKPKSGQTLSILKSQVQFSSDCLISSPLVFEAWVDIPNVGKVAIPSTKIKYKNEKDFISACNGGQDIIKAWGSCLLDTCILAFNYARPKPIKSSTKVEIRVYVQDHVELTGSLANGTFYVATDTE